MKINFYFPFYMSYIIRRVRGKHLALAAVAIFALVFTNFLLSPDTAKGDDNVTVTATVNSALSCAVAGTSISFGTLTTGAISTASQTTTTTLSCNNGSGCTLYLDDVGYGGNPGLASTTAGYLIGSADGSYGDTATLAAGTEGYGLQVASSTGGSGGSVTIAARYLQTGNDVGGLEVAALAAASSSEAILDRVFVTVYKAAISSTTASSDYTDTITYSCLAN